MPIDLFLEKKESDDDKSISLTEFLTCYKLQLVFYRKQMIIIDVDQSNGSKLLRQGARVGKKEMSKSNMISNRLYHIKCVP